MKKIKNINLKTNDPRKKNTPIKSTKPLRIGLYEWDNIIEGKWEKNMKLNTWPNPVFNIEG